MTKISVCVAGWHYKPSLYTGISKLHDVTDFYIMAHRPVDNVFKSILNKQGFKIIDCPNKGFDWGCYQQWLDLGYWKNYDYCFFIHDDVVIRSDNLITVASTLLKGNKLSIIGNGVNGEGHVKWPSTHAKYYEHSNWKPPKDFEHLTVRGSFFGISKATIEAIGAKFEVNWDGTSLKDANTSLVSTCGKIAYLTGNKIDYLSSTYMNSPYLIEIYRGMKYEPVPGRAQKMTREQAKKIFQARVDRLK